MGTMRPTTPLGIDVDDAPMQLDPLDDLVPPGERLVPLERDGLSGPVDRACLQLVVDLEGAVTRGALGLPTQRLYLVEVDPVGAMVRVAVPVNLDLLG
jgi:hypothetical protein